MDTVLLISQLPPPLHGSTMMTRFLLDSLRSEGFTVSVLERRFSKVVSEIGQMSAKKIFSALYMPARLVRAMLALKPHVVVFFVTNRRFSFLVDAALSETLALFKTRQILYVHTVGFGELGASRITNLLAARIFKRAERVVVLGNASQRDLLPYVDPAKFAVIPNTTHPPGLTLGPPARKILFLSNLIPEKGADTFVLLAERLTGERLSVEFVVAGASVAPDFETGLKRRVLKNSDLTPLLTFAGSITDARTKWELMASAYVLAFPSRYKYEAQPLTILEAMAVGVPVVAFDTGGISDLVEHGVTGLLYAPGDVDGMVAGISHLLREPETRKKMSAASLLAFESKFSLHAYSAAWSALVRDSRG